MVQGLQHVASGWFPATSLSPVLVIFWVWYVVQWYICPFVVVVQLCLKSCKRRVLLLRWGLSEWLKVIKEAGRLLYCDGLASLKMVWGGGGSGRRQEEAFWASLTLFISSVTERWSPPLMCERASWLHVPLSASMSWSSSLCCHRFTELPLWGVCVSDLSSVYEHIAQPGMQGPVQIRFHNWTPEDSGASFSAARDTCSYPPTCLTWITRIRVWIPLIDIWKTFWGAAVVNPPVAL